MADIRSSSCIDSRRASLLAMMAQEDMDVYHVCDYLESYNNSVKDKDICEDGKGNHINATCRTSICEWMYRVVDHFGVAREGKFVVYVNELYHCLVWTHDQLVTFSVTHFIMM